MTFFAVAQFEIELGAVGTRHISFKVAALSDGSAAEAAEIHKDDVLVAIDGKSASSFSMEQIERLFRQDGREYLLSLKRGTKSSKRTLKPKGLSETVQ